MERGPRPRDGRRKVGDFVLELVDEDGRYAVSKRAETLGSTLGIYGRAFRIRC